VLSTERILQALATTCLVVCAVGIWLTRTYDAAALTILGAALTVIGGLGELAFSIALLTMYYGRRRS
jgi:hypothetical protein